ncbi:energy transducer TonB [Luteimonas wenzhouensis]|jgi:protein TonB|nr:energy transducer TonB [Luteimonas wenzhouensis]NLW96869.1 energy transducer TonB [Xanthomonadaceae bacterium]
MPDPNQPRPEADAPSPPAPSPPAAARRGRGALSLLLWLLLLVVIIATAWYFLGRGEEHAPPPAPVPIGEPVPEASRSPVSTPPASRDITARERASPSMRLPDREAQPLTRAVPAYPDTARRAGAEGTVVLQVEVDANGRPGDITVARRSGSRELDRAAEQAVRSWTFEPAMRDGKPVASTVQVPVDFHLDRR